MWALLLAVDTGVRRKVESRFLIEAGLIPSGNTQKLKSLPPENVGIHNCIYREIYFILY